VFSNLLHNAAKFTPPEGRVDVHVERAGEHVVVKVSDTGVGIAESMLERIFDLFSQVEDPLHKTQPGLGIGLTLARQLVELHRGTLTAASEGLGKGAIFRVRLPLVVRAGGAASALEPRKLESRPMRILIADDNVDGAVALRAMLALDGHDVRIVHGGREALREAAGFRPEVVLLDIGMPDLDGFEVCRRMRAASDRRTVIAALTGWGQDEHRARARDAGFDRHFVKPPDPEQLRLLLHEAARK
jgi:CheY-like chemotaxis protein